MTETPRSASPVDWEFARPPGPGSPPGPKVSADEAAGVVASVRLAASRAQQPVADTARLHAPGTAPGAPGRRPPHVDRHQRRLDVGDGGPVFAEMVAKRKQPPSAAVASVGGKVTGGEAGALLAFMASKVLGQYDLAPEGTPRLLLVAPEPRARRTRARRQPEDFRLWVCMARRPTACSSPPCRGCATT